MNLYKYSTTAGNNDAAVPDGFPENWTGQQVNDSMREFAAAVRTHISDAAYVDETYQLASVGAKTLTRNSTSQFQVNNCDATAHFTAGRRIRVVGSTTDYGYVTSSSFSTHTIVNVVMDSGDVPTTPTQALVHVDAQIRSGAYYKTGSGNSLDADQLDGYHAADIFGTAIFSDALVNGSMSIWQRGTTGSCPAATRTYHADRWWTNPAGAAVTCDRTTSTPTGAVSRYAKKITGATSVTTCEIAGQRIESNLIPYIKTTVTFSALIKNETGTGLVITLLLGTPASADDFTTVTNRGTNIFSAIASGATVRLEVTADISGYTNIDNGLEVIFRSASGRLDSGTKSITITEIQIDRSSAFSYYKLRAMPDEINRCQRYYAKTFAYDTAPAQNWVGSGSGLPAGVITMAGSSGSGTNAGVSWPLAVPMRATPTVTTFNPRVAAATARDIDDGNSRTLTVTASTSVINFAASVSTIPCCFGATADAEL